MYLSYWISNSNPADIFFIPKFSDLDEIILPNGNIIRELSLYRPLFVIQVQRNTLYCILHVGTVKMTANSHHLLIRNCLLQSDWVLCWCAWSSIMGVFWDPLQWLYIRSWMMFIFSETLKIWLKIAKSYQIVLIVLWEHFYFSVFKAECISFFSCFCYSPSSTILDEGW